MANPPLRSKRSQRTFLLVAILGVTLSSVSIISLLSSIEWDASALLRVGADDSRITSFVEEQLDHVRPLAPLGHDGKFYFIQGHDPLLLQPDQAADLLDRPLYRSQRMLYPFLASLGGVLDGWGVVWGLIVVNLLAIAVGTWATSRLAVAVGASPWLGIAFAVNPGVVFELIIDGAGALGWALAVLGVWLIVDGKFAGAVVALVAAVLAREAMILVALGLAFRLWRTDHLRAMGVVAWPAAAALLWGVWVRWQLGVPLMTFQSEEIGPPFVGLGGAISGWVEHPGRNPIFGAIVIVFLLVAVMQAVRRPSFASYSVLGFVLLAPFLTRQVWLNYFDIGRAVAPVFTVFVLMVFAREPEDVVKNSVHAG